ncbi:MULTISPECIES: hypothetical protein [unclassified Pseudoxanthomonas]
MPRDRSPTGPSEARAWVTELMKRLPWRWIAGASVLLFALLAGWMIGGR